MAHFPPFSPPFTIEPPAPPANLPCTSPTLDAAEPGILHPSGQHRDGAHPHLRRRVAYAVAGLVIFASSSALGPRADRAGSADSQFGWSAVESGGTAEDTADTAARARRAAAFQRDFEAHRADPATGRRDTHDIALDARLLATPWDGTPEGTTHPLEAVDGDESTAWRGAADQSFWVLNLPFRRPVHPALVRIFFGDASNAGVPKVYRWEYQAPARGRCGRNLPFALLPGGAVDDRDPNQFVHGPNTIHARRQVLFADVDACALRLVIANSEGGPPVVREIRILEGARSLAAEPGVLVDAEASDAGGSTFPAALRPAPSSIAPRNVLDGHYGTLWEGAPEHDRWTLTLRLPRARTIDRVSLSLGLDAVTIPRVNSTGRSYGAANMPLAYELSTSPDGDPTHNEPIAEAAPPTFDETPLPVRRRLIHLAEPRLVKTLTLIITRATDPFGGEDPALRAPIVRDIGLYDARDPRPVVKPPLFWSVDANPSVLTHRLEWGEEGADGQFARDDYHRLERIVVGLGADSGWPADASRRRDAGRGRFVEAIEGDDPLLDRPLVEAESPPPILLLSGSFNWDFDERTAPPPPIERTPPIGPRTAPKDSVPWRWNVLARASEPDRGMGQLVDLVRDRTAPLVGFCGGAHILGLLEAAAAAEQNADDPDPTPETDGSTDELGESPSVAHALIDSVLARNVNRPIHPVVESSRLYERAWWTDAPATDAQRPVVQFDPKDPLFAALPEPNTSPARTTSRELPVSHMDMLRASAFEPGGPLADLRVSAFSNFCRPYVDAHGPEPTFTDPHGTDARCVRIPQAFHSVDPARFPIIGMQFHPEQRDLTRLAEGSPPDARGDALNIFADAIDMILDSYVRLFWPHA